MQVVRFEDVNINEYENFVKSDDKNLVYLSAQYKMLLERMLKAESIYFIAVDNNKIVGILPSFLIRNSKYGSVINSLPFYGSNGGIISSSEEVRDGLLNAFNNVVKEERCVSSTIITSPFETNLQWYDDNVKYSFIDERIGQITFLPKIEDGMDISDALMKLFHYKTRNSIRKAEKQGVEVIKCNDDNAWKYLFEQHELNMNRIGGLSKDKLFFDSIKLLFQEDSDYNIYLGKYNGEIVSACLVLYYNKTVEYFVPVTTEEYRNLQPLSRIIVEIMKDAVLCGYENWNWGGTWLSQGGVYDFKKKWGTKDLKYFYYNKVYDESILKIDKEEILKEYKNFYVFPFDKEEMKNE